MVGSLCMRGHIYMLDIVLHGLLQRSKENVTDIHSRYRYIYIYIYSDNYILSLSRAYSYVYTHNNYVIR